jgi:hypothetical protein
MDRSYVLLGLLLDYAPDAAAQILVTEMYNEMKAAGETDQVFETNLINSLSDGINHGNWPWFTRVAKAPGEPV